MMVRRIHILSGILLAACTAAVRAEDVRVTASVDRKAMALNERLTLQVTVAGTQNAVPPRFRELTGLRVLQGPSTSKQMNIVNGAMSSSVTFTYVLGATAHGAQTIGPIEVSVGSQMYVTTPMTVQVSESPTPADAEDGAGQPVFLTLQADRTNVYMNEQVLLTITLYYRSVQIVNVAQPQLALKGFDLHEMPYQQPERVINDIVYKTVQFPVIALPLQAGRQTLGPVTMKISVREPVARTQRGFFDDGFFGGGLLDEFLGRFQVVEREIVSNPLTLEVQPLPDEGRPASFAGAVGQYALRASIQPADVQAGSAVTLTATLEGQGNIGAVSLSLPTNTPEMRVYDPKATRDVGVNGTLLVGRREYTQMLIPITEAVREVPAITFAYFDPARKEYVQLQQGPFPLRVTPAPAGSEMQIVDFRPAAVGAGTVKVLAEDILGLKTRTNGTAITRRAVHDTWCLAGLAAPPVVWLGALAVARRRERLRTDHAWSRRLNAGGRLHTYLRAARAALKQHDQTALCAAVSDAMTHYIADQLHASAPQVSAAALPGLLAPTRVRPETLQEIRGILEECDFGRFGGAHFDAAHARALLARAERAAQRLQRELR